MFWRPRELGVSGGGLGEDRHRSQQAGSLQNEGERASAFQDRQEGRGVE